MQGKHIFEYAVIRVVPRVEREEFINVGVILYCRALDFLQAKCMPDEKRLLAFAPQLDMREIKNNLDALCHISKGDEKSGPIGKLSLPERFRWLTATRSTVVQSSKVHSGFCDDAAETLERLFNQLVSLDEDQT